MLTEDDLRSALADFAHDTDEAAARDRLENSLQSPRRALGARLTPIAAIAACIALAVGLAIGVQAIRHHRTPAVHPPTPTSGPTIYGMKQFPGTVVLAHFSGTGPKTFDAGNYTAPNGLQLQVVVTCRGKGLFSYGAGTFQSGCSSSNVGAGGGSVEARDLHPMTITTAATSAWKITLIAAPDSQTNGGTVNPVITSHDVEVTATGSGQGDGSILVNLHDTAKLGYEIYATCSGGGITINANSPAVQNDYTRTCFPGFSYNWKIPKGASLTRLDVTAAADTTWTVIVTPD